MARGWTGSRNTDSHSAHDRRSARTFSHLYGSHTDTIRASDDDFHHTDGPSLGKQHTHSNCNSLRQCRAAYQGAQAHENHHLHTRGANHRGHIDKYPGRANAYANSSYEHSGCDPAGSTHRDSNPHCDPSYPHASAAIRAAQTQSICRMKPPACRRLPDRSSAPDQLQHVKYDTLQM